MIIDYQLNSLLENYLKTQLVEFGWADVLGLSLGLLHIVIWREYSGCFNVMKLEYNKSALQRSNRLAVRTKEKLQTASPIPTFLTKDIVRSSWTFTAVYLL